MQSNAQEVTFRIGGEAGMGLESSGIGLAKALVRGGLHVFGLPDYHSRIRGGHNFFTLRIARRPLFSHAEPLHLLLALDQETIRRHIASLVPGGAVVYDEQDGLPDIPRRSDIAYFPIPLARMAQETGGSEVMRNTLLLAFAAGLLEFDPAYIEGVARENFARKGPAVVEANLRVIQAGVEAARPFRADFPFRMPAVPHAPPRLLLNGNQAFALGALAGGCRFVAGYPMTPGSPVLEWMAAHAAEYGIVTLQVEDEIAALCMAVGASYAGARALVPTSGGGFSLMVEALGLAGMTEVPVVIYEAQRPGPSTGLATRTEQGDLLFALHASQGEFPRILLSPGTAEQAFEAGWRAFNLAERFQCPVIVLSDHYLATSVRDVPPEALGWEAVELDRGELLGEAELDALEDFRRHRFTESGISPRAIPGHPQAVYASSSDEHNEYGHIEEEAENRRRMMEKRMRKLEAAREWMRPPAGYGAEEAELTLLGWGSTYGPLREAVDRLNEQGRRVRMLHFTDLWPFPHGVEAGLVGKTVAVENNYSGQLADLIRMATGHAVSHRILKWDGRPLSPEYILRAL
ncbi:MAG: 2-oxoacid:acceptor oxidoreductase subunit alpha [Chloroflexia bacterium]